MVKMMPRILLALLNILAVSANEQACSSFSYDEKMLKKIVRIQDKVEERDEALRDWETMMENSLAQLKQKQKNMSKTIATTEKIIAEINSSMTVWETAIKKKLESHDLTVQSFLGKSLYIKVQLSISRRSGDLFFTSSNYPKCIW